MDRLTHCRFMQAFLAAAQAGDMARLEQVLLRDVGQPTRVASGRPANG
ncbi:hypothetical protein [Streptomyces sp. NPDC003393]